MAETTLHPVLELVVGGRHGIYYWLIAQGQRHTPGTYGLRCVWPAPHSRRTVAGRVDGYTSSFKAQLYGLIGT